MLDIHDFLIVSHRHLEGYRKLVSFTVAALPLLIYGSILLSWLGKKIEGLPLPIRLLLTFIVLGGLVPLYLYWGGIQMEVFLFHLEKRYLLPVLSFILGVFTILIEAKK